MVQRKIMYFLISNSGFHYFTGSAGTGSGPPPSAKVYEKATAFSISFTAYRSII